MAALVREPVYLQLNEALRGLLRGRTFKSGQQFLTERQVSERFRVSRITANKALSNLVSEGILEFRKGVGTFVRGRVLDYDLRSLVSFTRKASAAGKRPTTRVLQFFPVPARQASRRLAEVLGVRPADELYFMERLRVADGVPVILERRWVVAAQCPGIRKDELRGSLYALWTGRFGLEIAGADETIRAVSLKAPEARALGTRAGAAALAVQALGTLRGGIPLWWERTLYRGDAYAFRNRLGPVATARPAIGSFAPIEEDLG